MELLSRFRYLIRKLERKLNYEYAETDLIIAFIELIEGIDIDKIKNKSDGGIVNYINISLKRKAYFLYKLNLNIENEMIEYNDNISDMSVEPNLKLIEFNLNLNCLNKVQKKIIIDKYINNLTYIEIASELGISRQAVYSNKIKAINLLEKYLL